MPAITLAGSPRLVQDELCRFREHHKKKYGDLSVEEIDLRESESTDVRAHVSSPPFLSESKMIVLKGLSTSSLSDDTESIISGLADSVQFVIVEPSIDKRKGVYKTLKSTSDFREFQPLTGQQLGKWVQAQAASAESKISSANVAYLIDRVGEDQTRLKTEVEKLSVYPEITREIVTNLTEARAQSKIFELLEACLDGRLDRALELYEDQRSQKTEPAAVLALIVWQLRLLVATKHNDNVSSLARELKTGEFAVQKAAGRSRGLSSAQIKRLVDLSLESERVLKSDYADGDEVVKLLLAEITTVVG